jgi:hypothetical protein
LRRRGGCGATRLGDQGRLQGRGEGRRAPCVLGWKPGPVTTRNGQRERCPAHPTTRSTPVASRIMSSGRCSLPFVGTMISSSRTPGGAARVEAPWASATTPPHRHVEPSSARCERLRLRVEGGRQRLVLLFDRDHASVTTSRSSCWISVGYACGPPMQGGPGASSWGRIGPGPRRWSPGG